MDSRCTNVPKFEVYLYVRTDDRVGREADDIYRTERDIFLGDKCKI